MREPGLGRGQKRGPRGQDGQAAKYKKRVKLVLSGDKDKEKLPKDEVNSDMVKYLRDQIKQLNRDNADLIGKEATARNKLDCTTLQFEKDLRTEVDRSFETARLKFEMDHLRNGLSEQATIQAAYERGYDKAVGTLDLLQGIRPRGRGPPDSAAVAMGPIST